MRFGYRRPGESTDIRLGSTANLDSDDTESSVGVDAIHADDELVVATLVLMDVPRSGARIHRAERGRAAEKYSLSSPDLCI